MARLHKQEVPFAATLALTRTANRARDHIRGELGKTFEVRRKSFLRASIQTQRAEKRDFPHIQARVGTRDKFMAHHATGATRRKRSSELTVPNREIVKRTRRGKFFKRQKPTTLLAKGGRGFIAKARGRPAIFKRKGRGRRSAIQLMFMLRSEVKIKPEWPFTNQARDAFSRHYKREFLRALGHAVRSSRK